MRPTADEASMRWIMRGLLGWQRDLSRSVRHRLDASAEDGMTLVEMVVALFLVSMVLMAFVGVAIAGAGASRAADVRSRANQLGNQEVEQLKSISWADLGLYDNDGASCGTEPLVSLGATAPGTRVAPQYQRSLVRSGRTYTVTDCVTWTDDPADGLNANGTETDSDSGQDVKHLVVKVTYTLLSKTRTVTFDSVRTPTAVEVPPTVHTTGATLALTGSSASPATQQLSGSYSLQQAMTLSVTASLAATSMTVTYTGRTGAATKTLSSSDGGLNWTVVIGTDPSADGTFNPGTTTFTFHGSSASGSAQRTTDVAFTAPPTPFTLSAAASPSSVTLDSSGYLTAPITITATTSIAATAVSVSYPTKAGTGTGSLTSANGTSWSLVLAANTTNGPYNPASPEVFSLTGTAASGTTTGTTSVTLTPPAPPAVVVKSAVVPTYASGTLCTDSNGGNTNLTRDVNNVKITITNLVASDVVKLSWTGPNGGPVTAGAGVASGSDFVFTAVIPLHTSFTQATTTFTVSTTRASDGAQNQFPSTVTIQSKNKNTACT